MKKKKQPFSTKESYEKRINNTFLQWVNPKCSWDERVKLLEEYRKNRGGK